MKLAHILVCHSVSPDKLFASIPHAADHFWLVFFHGSDPALASHVAKLVAGRGGHFFPYMTNRGLAKSWNDGLHLAQQAGCDAHLLLNDDLFFYDGAYHEFAEIIEAVGRISNKNVSFISLMGLESGASPLAGQVIAQSFACCAITRDAIDRVGYFDENFTPAYYEDIDYARRAALSGMTVHIHPRVSVEHERSATSRTSDEIRKAGEATFARNRAYFERKWGGSDGAESFMTPFNNPDIGLKIPFEQKSEPYDLQTVDGFASC